MEKYILAINPGSTSTKVSLFNGEEQIKSHKIDHKKKDLDQYENISDQFSYRLDLIEDWMRTEEIFIEQLRAVVGRGGLLPPMPGGTYKVSEKMEEDLKVGIQGEHASNLGGLLAKGIGGKNKLPAFIVDPVSVDEMKDIARISGVNIIDRKSLVHALNIKAVAHRRSEELGKKLEDINLVIAHLGGGISIAAMSKGKIIDVNNSREMGPFSPDRTGSLPVRDLVDMCYSGQYTFKEMKTKIQGEGGLYSYLNTMDGRDIEKQIKEKDEYAKLIYDAMAYQIGKEIGCYGTVIYGNIDNIILTGGLAYSDYLVKKIEPMISFLAEIVIYPGEDEMGALNKGVLRVLQGKEKFKIYEEEVSFNG